MAKKSKIKWFDKPEKHDYPAAMSYLSLIYDTDTVNEFIKLLELAPISSYKAKDIFRASGLSLLGISNSHIKKDSDKISAKEKLSSLLLVRDKLNSKVIIVDGYHRLCAVYAVNEDAIIPCKIV